MSFRGRLDLEVYGFQLMDIYCGRVDHRNRTCRQCGNRHQRPRRCPGCAAEVNQKPSIFERVKRTNGRKAARASR